MKELVQKVKQWGIDKGLDKVGHLAQAEYTLKETAELLDAYADKDIDAINDAIGDILVTLIVGASNSFVVYSGVEFNLSSEEGFTEAGRNSSDSFQHVYNDTLDCVFNVLFESKSCDIDKYDYILTFYSLQRLLRSINREFKQSLTLQDCLQLAYDEIKDRTGKMVNGQFIKDN